MTAFSDGTTFRAATLLAMDGYPPADRVGTFYGESVSLTKFLVDRVTPQQFVEFVVRAQQDGYDAALQGCYGIDGEHQLDRQWRQNLNPMQLASYQRPLKSRASRHRPAESAPSYLVPMRHTWADWQVRHRVWRLSGLAVFHSIDKCPNLTSHTS